MLWKLSPQKRQDMIHKYEDYEELCNACYRKRQYDKLNNNKFSSGFAVDTMRLKAKLEFECTQCGTRAELADSPFLNVSPLHLALPFLRDRLAGLIVF
jgi:hypothetical protein